MACKNLLATAMLFVFACVLTCRGEVCETYDGNGLCILPCSEGRVLYSAVCENTATSERTCRQPETRALEVRCDYTRCQCPGPKVWDEAARKCVKLGECSDQLNY